MKKWTRPGWKNPKFAELKHYFPVFSNFKLTLVIAPDVVAATYYIADRDYLKDPEPGSDTEALTVSNAVKGYATIIYKPTASAGDIAHEAYHAVCALMKFAGAGEEHEVVAYHLGYIVDMMAKFQKKVVRRFPCPKKSKFKRQS